jgi:cobalamin biosynthesis protein CobD/CbiB
VVIRDLLHERRSARAELVGGVALLASVPLAAVAAYLLAHTLSMVAFMMYLIVAGTFGTASIMVGAIRMHATTRQLRLEGERIPRARLLT